MKRKTISNLLLTSSVLFFSACSGTTPKIDKTSKKIQHTSSLSAYNIIGIDRNKPMHTPMFVVANPAKTNFNIQIVEPRTIKNIRTYPEAIYSNNIPKPLYENITSYPPLNNIIETDDSINYETDNSINYATNDSIDIIKYAPTLATHSDSYSENIEVISYASKKNTSTPNLNLIKNEIESKAKSFLGTKYVWGATGPSKFDCSGFTQWVYRDSGITIPRVSKDQAKVGNYVEYANLRRGDMVFFDTKKQRSGIVTHVGIYLGNNNFIHASSGAKKVVIYNFNDKPYYKKRFLWGRRVINNGNNYLASR